MADFPLISVVIPCLNRAQFLVPTIESVLRQDYPNIEGIVVDGDSTDGTLDILRSYEGRIKWVSERDNGHADAINKGWRISKGEILAWLNADDMWVVPNAVSQAVAYFQAHPEVDVVYGDCALVDGYGNMEGMNYLHEWNLEYAVENCDHCIPQPAAFIRRRMLEEVNWLDTDFYQKKDHELWLRIGLVGRIQHIPVLLAQERMLPGLSFDGRTAAPACVQVTRKVFSLPGVPESLRQKQRRAMSNSYLRGMHYAWMGGRLWSIIIPYTIRAIVADLSNAGVAVNRLLGYMIKGARDDRRLRFLLVAYTVLNAPRSTYHKVRSVLHLSRLPKFEEWAPAPQNLLGDQDVERSWIAAHVPAGPGEAVEFGNTGYLALLAAQRGFNVRVVSANSILWPYEHPRLRFIAAETLTELGSQEHLDLVINCSAMKGIGLIGQNGGPGRYDADLEAMVYLRELIKPGGLMLLTVPVGQELGSPRFCRVYDTARLPRLMDGFTVENQVFWMKNNQNRWVLTDKETALNFKASVESNDPLKNIHALGCFVLRKPERTLAT